MNNLIDRIITSLIAAAVLFIAVPDAMAADPHMPVKKVLTATDTIADAPDAVEIQLGEADVAAVLPDSIAELLDESPYDRWIPRKSNSIRTRHEQCGWPHCSQVWDSYITAGTGNYLS